MVSVVLGARRVVHSSMLRTDSVIKEMFGWKRGLGDQSTFSRLFKKFSIEGNDLMFSELMRKWWSRMEIEKMTIDLDSTVVTRYGHQEGAEVGYNPTKHGRSSHHPLIAFCAELKMVVNGWMRPGNTNDANAVDHFLAQVLRIIPAKRIGLLRADSGFYGDLLMTQLEVEKVLYIIRGRMTSALADAVVQAKNWYADDSVFDDAEYAEIKYKATGWDRPRRAIVVRRPKKEDEVVKKTKAKGILFQDELIHRQYNISVYFTTSALSAVQVHSLYNQRADCENRIKELKYDYGMDGFAMKTIGATEAAFRFVLSN